LRDEQVFQILDNYGSRGVAALANATPVDTSETALSWTYEVVSRRGYHAIHWHNTHVVEGIPVAVMIEYGHGTGTGGYVPPHPFITNAIRPIFEEIVAEIIREVKSL
jgi:hypothetical protein